MKHKWKKGESGNPGGRARNDKLFGEAVRIAVNDIDPATGRKNLRIIAEKMVELAKAGEAWAVQQVADRLDGKPAQESSVTITRAIEELSDDELAGIIATNRSSDGAVETPSDPSKLN